MENSFRKEEIPLCECMDGYRDYTPNKEICCHHSCQECTENSEKCQSCPSTRKMNEILGFCECKDFYVEDGNNLECTVNF